MELPERIQEIQDRIGQAAIRAGRQPGSVTLLAVSKTVPATVLKQAYDLGLRCFGENRIQEALPKIEELPSDIEWHLIGRLQTNKINKIIARFVLIHSVDSLELANDLSHRMRGGTQDVLLEVNTSNEPSKAGVAMEDAVIIAESIAQLPGLKLRGLMTIGPLVDDKHRQRNSFKNLKGLFETIRKKEWVDPSFSVLSMGMSGDFEMAIEEGSTLVRVGTAIFGGRA